jgi:hypothetical protein
MGSSADLVCFKIQDIRDNWDSIINSLLKELSNEDYKNYWENGFNYYEKLFFQSCKYENIENISDDELFDFLSIFNKVKVHSWSEYVEIFDVEFGPYDEMPYHFNNGYFGFYVSDQQDSFSNMISYLISNFCKCAKYQLWT